MTRGAGAGGSKLVRWPRRGAGEGALTLRSATALAIPEVRRADRTVGLGSGSPGRRGLGRAMVRGGSSEGAASIESGVGKVQRRRWESGSGSGGRRRRGRRWVPARARSDQKLAIVEVARRRGCCRWTAGHDPVEALKIDWCGMARLRHGSWGAGRKYGPGTRDRRRRRSSDGDRRWFR
ncbi:pollen-specific leucine-rich repeat extensin-like protein 3 [Iris pallida]|uniref:Pollen-specific leucine-rich repeat extensin-like protein 3 n=1 Tax=Iris pallida TaxID=29817 RepID=A0AAX6I5T8_IRIPA|nr:pollen-specific leucine-rich repeat extensin-like protein 3 [Iris pallida]